MRITPADQCQRTLLLTVSVGRHSPSQAFPTCACTDLSHGALEVLSVCLNTRLQHLTTTYFYILIVASHLLALLPKLLPFYKPALFLVSRKERVRFLRLTGQTCPLPAFESKEVLELSTPPGVCTVYSCSCTTVAELNT